MANVSNVTGGGGFPSEPPSGIYTTHKENIWKVIPPMLIVWGVVGNILTILVIVRQMRRLTSTGIYLLALAFSDILVLLCGPLRQWIVWKWQLDVRHLSEPGCKIHKYLTYASFQFSSWLLVAVTVERAISVVLPTRVRHGCTPKLATITLCVIFACIFGLNAHFLYGYGETEVMGGTYPCYIQTSSYRTFMDDVFPWIDFCVVFFIPFIILLVCNVIIINKLSKTKRNRRQMSIGQRHKLTKSENANRTIMIMLVVLSVVFFISMTPVSVFYIIYPYHQRAIDKLMATDPLAWWRAIEYFTFWEAIVNIIGYVNSSFNFILYVLSGSRFRKELKALLTCDRAVSEPVFSTSGDSKKTLRTSASGSSTLSNRRVNEVNASISDGSMYSGPGPVVDGRKDPAVLDRHNSTVSFSELPGKDGMADPMDVDGEINTGFQDDEQNTSENGNIEQNLDTKL